MENITKNLTMCPLIGDEEVYISYILIVICFSFFGLIGNILVLFTVLLNASLRSVVNLIIASLAMSSILSVGVCCPLDIYRLYWGYVAWILPVWTCKLFWFLELATNFSIAFNIALFAIYRLKTILNPYKIVNMTRLKMMIILFILWIFAFSIAIPLVQFAVVRNKRTAEKKCGIASCSVEREEENDHDYVSAIFFLVFIIVYVGICGMSLLFIGYSCKKNKNSKSTAESTIDKVSGLNFRIFVNDQQRTNFKQYILILACFLVSYTPIIVFMVKHLSSDENHHETRSHFKFVTSLFTRYFEFLYFVMVLIGSKKIREAVLNKFFNLCS